MSDLSRRSISFFAIVRIILGFVVYVGATGGIAMAMHSLPFMVRNPDTVGPLLETVVLFAAYWVADSGSFARFSWPGYVAMLLLSILLSWQFRWFFAIGGAAIVLQAEVLQKIWGNNGMAGLANLTLGPWEVYVAGALGGLAARWVLYGHTKAPWRRYS